MSRKRWNCQTNNFEEIPEVDAFIAEVLAVCKKHGFAISHEDGHGAFEIVPIASGDSVWLCAAHWDPS